jgi:hypothetical protein
LSKSKSDRSGNEEYQPLTDELTPMIFNEFMECESVYLLSEKDGDSEISSDGEFNDARKIKVL